MVRVYRKERWIGQQDGVAEGKFTNEELSGGALVLRRRGESGLEQGVVVPDLVLAGVRSTCQHH
jgi:hypothetical protein